MPMSKLFTNSTRLSKKRLNNKGDKINPCIKPLETLHQSVVSEFTGMQARADV